MSTKKLALSMCGIVIFIFLLSYGIYGLFCFSGAEIKINSPKDGESVFIRLYVDGNYYDKMGVSSGEIRSLGIDNEELGKCSHEGIMIVIEKNSRAISGLERDCNFRYLEIQLNKNGEIIENETKIIK
ncbi:hypothetical protein [Zymobacter sp. IVIA_12111.31 C1]|uniref:hypothetical protein n=1 Tax=Zymobacter sp. IVIA_12111.31 C1 TaxID=3394854 RepID=UPI0039C1167E